MLKPVSRSENTGSVIAASVRFRYLSEETADRLHLNPLNKSRDPIDCMSGRLGGLNSNIQTDRGIGLVKINAHFAFHCSRLDTEASQKCTLKTIWDGTHSVGCISATVSELLLDFNALSRVVLVLNNALCPIYLPYELHSKLGV